MTMPTKWNGDENSFWDALAVMSDEDADEDDAIAASFLMQHILTLALDALTRPEQPEMRTDATPGARVAPSSVSSTRPAVSAPVPKRVERPRPGEVVTAERASELFNDHYVLRAMDPDKASAISAFRDYRMVAGQLQYNVTYPPDWQVSAGSVNDAPQWQVVCQQAAPAESNGHAPTPRVSRTTVRTA